MIEIKYIQRIAEELELSPTQVTKAIELLNGGAVIPFIARFRRDVTGNLDETQLERISERNTYFIGVSDRSQFLLKTLEENGVLTDEARQTIESTFDNAVLEDMGARFKRRRRTKATIAQDKGLAPLAEYLRNQNLQGTSIPTLADSFVRPEKSISSAEEALDGAGSILAEWLSLDFDTRQLVRNRMLMEGKITAHPTKNAEGRKTKYENYYEFSEPVQKIPSHRFLAVTRGVKEGFLRMQLAIEDERTVADALELHLKEKNSPFDPFIRAAVKEAYDHLLRPTMENEVINLLHQRADEEAIAVFRQNAMNILLAPPAGKRPVVGLDPSENGNTYAAVINTDGDLAENAVIAPKEDADPAEVLAQLMKKHDARAVAIGNSQGAREAASFVRSGIAKSGLEGAFHVFVSEAGAAVYAASKLGKEEFPDLELALRKAVSIARRLQDPLAELVKIEPRHIGVGQYQHDVNSKKLREGLHRTVVSAVNHVGADLNTAHAALLQYVSGIQAQTAAKIVDFRGEKGPFGTREQLAEVDGVGAKVFEQCAGFMRIHDGENPLDSTGIHPEAYPVVQRISEALELPLTDLIGHAEALKDLDLSPFETDVVGPLTLREIRDELAKPKRDPRTEFRAPRFLENVQSVQDLEEGMVMEGVVTNVTDFGAFVDIGVHQDGLVHLSELANRYVRDPRSVAKVGDVVRVKVIKVDKELPRISLSMKVLSASAEGHRRRRRRKPQDAAAGEQKGRHEHAAPPQGAEAERPPRTRRQKRKAPPKPRRDDGGRHGSGGGAPKQEPLVNTQLAEQLAALKDKLGS